MLYGYYGVRRYEVGHHAVLPRYVPVTERICADTVLATYVHDSAEDRHRVDHDFLLLFVTTM